MRNQLLRDTDWASMAHSLEVRVPLVDTQLMSHIALTAAEKQPYSKRMLGQSPRIPLPTRVLERPKTGFQTPIHAWLQRDNRMQGWRRVPALIRKKCGWARRWAFQVRGAELGNSTVIARTRAGHRRIWRAWGDSPV